MITPLEAGKRIRRLVTIAGTEYVLELTAAGVLLRRLGRRLPAAVMGLAELLERGSRGVVVILKREAKKRRRSSTSSARAPKRRRKGARRRA